MFFVCFFVLAFWNLAVLTGFSPSPTQFETCKPFAPSFSSTQWSLRQFGLDFPQKTAFLRVLGYLGHCDLISAGFGFHKSFMQMSFYSPDIKGKSHLDRHYSVCSNTTECRPKFQAKEPRRPPPRQRPPVLGTRRGRGGGGNRTPSTSTRC